MTMVCKGHATKRAAVKRGDEPEIFRLDGRQEKEGEGEIENVTQGKKEESGGCHRLRITVTKLA